MKPAWWISLLFCLAFAHPGNAAPPVLITNATVFTMAKGKIENGSVLIVNGKIAAVGHDVSKPAGALVIDGTGKFLTPGLIDCHSHTAVEGSINEGSVSDSAMVDTKDVLNPSDVNIQWALAGGLTVSNVLHGSANAIGGKTVVIKLRWGKTADQMIFEGAMPGIKFALGENPKRQGYPPVTFGPSIRERRYPGTRLGVADVFREEFTKAKIYQQSWRDYQDRVTRGQNPIPPRRDLKLDALVEVLEGKRYVHCHSYRADELLMLMQLADEMGFKIRTFQHVLEGYKVAKEIAARNIGASTFSDWWAYKYEVVDAIPYNAAIMTRKGVVVSLNSDSDELQRHLNYEAAKTMRYGGLSEEEALAMVTINPAKQLGIEKRVGSIETGKDADLVLWDAYPLSNYSKAERVWIDGEEYFNRDRYLREHAELETKKKALFEKQLAAAESTRQRREQEKKNNPDGAKKPNSVEARQ